METVSGLLGMAILLYLGGVVFQGLCCWEDSSSFPCLRTLFWPLIFLFYAAVVLAAAIWQLAGELFAFACLVGTDARSLFRVVRRTLHRRKQKNDAPEKGVYR